VSGARKRRRGGPQRRGNRRRAQAWRHGATLGAFRVAARASASPCPLLRLLPPSAPRSGDLRLQAGGRGLECRLSCEEPRLTPGPNAGAFRLALVVSDRQAAGRSACRGRASTLGLGASRARTLSMRPTRGVQTWPLALPQTTLLPPAPGSPCFQEVALWPQRPPLTPLRLALPRGRERGREVFSRASTVARASSSRESQAARSCRVDALPACQGHLLHVHWMVATGNSGLLLRAARVAGTRLEQRLGTGSDPRCLDLRPSPQDSGRSSAACLNWEALSPTMGKPREGNAFQRGVR